MGKPGKSRPGSGKSEAERHCQCSDLMRGDNSDRNHSKRNGDDRQALGNAESEKLYRPESEPVKLYDGSDLIRARIVSLVFGSIITIAVLGVISIIVLTIFGIPTDATVKFLTTLLSPLFSVVTFIAGYYFGHRRHKSRDGMA